MKGRSYCFKKKGHTLSLGKQNSNPKSEWAINKATKLLQAQNLMTNRNTARNETVPDMTSTITTSQSTGNSSYPFAGMQTR
jgi:hypothetical protein